MFWIRGFSSSLWPITTLGWPNNTAELKEYFPTDVLVTGFDIIFFWVSRMMMQSLNATNKLPFKKVYIHPLIRDKYGQKMSKSKGNIIDPLNLIDKYGADSLRLTLASLAAQGKDIKLSEETVKLNRNFITKIWNSYKFLKMNECIKNSNFRTDKKLLDINIWLLKNLNDLILSVTKSIENFRFNDAVKAIYVFTKNIYCDWYIEAVKVLLSVLDNKNQIEEIRNCSFYCFGVLLKVSHPFIPFVSDEIYVHCIKNKNYLDLEDWPKKSLLNYKKLSLNKITFTLELITKIRNIRSSLKIQTKSILILLVNKKLISKNITSEIEQIINRLARVKIQFHNANINKDYKYSKFFLQSNLFHIIYKKIKISLKKLKIRIYLF